MTKYKVYTKDSFVWLAEEDLIAALEKFRDTHGHRCNKIADPGVCCPTAHGASEDECDCLSLKHFDMQEFPE